MWCLFAPSSSWGGAEPMYGMQTCVSYSWCWSWEGWDMTLFLILGCFGSKAKDTLQNAREYCCATPWQHSSDANMASSSLPSMIRTNGHEEGLRGLGRNGCRNEIPEMGDIHQFWAQLWILPNSWVFAAINILTCKTTPKYSFFLICFGQKNYVSISSQRPPHVNSFSMNFEYISNTHVQ